MTGTLTLADLDAIRAKYGCNSDKRGTQPYAAAWSKAIVDGTSKFSAQLGVTVNTSFPKHEPVLNTLKGKFKGFGWARKDTQQDRPCLEFRNYPGADKGSMLTLADLLILSVEQVDSYVALLNVEQKKVPRRTKRKGRGSAFGRGRAYSHAWS